MIFIIHMDSSQLQTAPRQAEREHRDQESAILSGCEFGMINIKIYVIYIFTVSKLTYNIKIIPYPTKN